MSIISNNKIAATFLAVVVGSTTLSGCSKDPISTERTDNPEITYDTLFTRHGCEVGRIQDNGRSVYTTFCPAP